MVKKNFIQKAIKRPGALTRKARAAGESIDQFARSHMEGHSKAAQESRFYEDVLKKVGKHGARKHAAKMKKPHQQKVHPVRMKSEGSLLAHVLKGGY